MTIKNVVEAKHEIGDMVHLEGYLEQDVSRRTFFGIITDRVYDNRTKEWIYDVTIDVKGDKVETVVKENAILVKTDLN